MKGKHCFKNIAKFVKEEREAAGLSQSEMAKRIGWNNGQFVSNIEREQCSLPVKLIGRASVVLKCNPKNIKRVIEMDFKETLNNFSSDHLQ